VISRGDGRVEVSLESPASAGLFRFRLVRQRGGAARNGLSNCPANVVGSGSAAP